MKRLAFLIIPLLLASCGKGGGKSSSGENASSPISSQLSEEECKVLENVLKKGFAEEKQILKELLTLEKLSEETLRKLDNHINIKCSSGICEVTKKEIK
jgi:hypothetical protein